jgi:hypothetical protein
MTTVAETLERRIRERAYYIWEASGRPPGRDEEFWRQACEVIATDQAPTRSTAQQRENKPARSPRRRSRTNG